MRSPGQTHSVSDKTQIMLWSAVGLLVLGAIFVSVYLGS